MQDMTCRELVKEVAKMYVMKVHGLPQGRKGFGTDCLGFLTNFKVNPKPPCRVPMEFA